jgi:hypothetical protein
MSVGFGLIRAAPIAPRSTVVLHTAPTFSGWPFAGHDFAGTPIQRLSSNLGIFSVVNQRERTGHWTGL